MRKEVDIKNRYSSELEDIFLTLQSIEREVNHKYKDDNKEYLISITKNIRNKIDDLIDKVEYNKESIKDTINKNFPE